MAAISGTDWLTLLCKILNIPTHGLRKIEISIPYEDVVEVHITRIVHDTQLTEIYELIENCKAKRIE